MVPDMGDTWKPAVYERFRAERDRPLDDLLALVRPVSGGRVIDLGCGSGSLTARLHRQTGASETIGVDTSASMLSAAPTVDGVEFRHGDLTSFAGEGFDLVFANASLQWIPDHRSLFAHVWSLIRPGGQLAVHVPSNFDHPSHVVADQVGRAFGLEPLDRSEQVLTSVEYATLLHGLGALDEHVRLVVYGARLDRTDDVIAWVQGSLLTHYERELEARFDDFMAEYRARVLEALGDPTGAEPYYYPFPRILMTAMKPR